MPFLCKICRRWVVLAIFAQTALGIVSCTPIPEAEKGYSPATVTYRQAMAAANIAVRQNPGSTVLQAIGVSMLPKYGNNTLFVVKPIAWDALRPGMDVAYKRPSGDIYVHELITDGGDFWIVGGINNTRVDDFHVTRDNLVGQVLWAISYIRPDDANQ